MMEKKKSTEVETDEYPLISHASPASARNNSKIGRIKIKTPAEINKEFHDTPNSSEINKEFEGTPNSSEINKEFDGTSNSVDSSDRLRAISFADFLLPPDPPPSLPNVSPVSQLKEPSSQLVKPKRKSRYPGFGETIRSQLKDPSSQLAKPKRKRRYPFLTPSKAIITYSTSTVNTSSLPPSSFATSSSTKSVPNVAGSGIRKNLPGLGGTTMPSYSQGNRLKEHRVSDTDARNISASWQTLKPSSSVSKSCAAISSSSQTAQDQVGESFSSQVKKVCPSHKQPQATPKLLQHFRSNPGFENEKQYNSSQPTGFNQRRDNIRSTPCSFPTSLNSTGFQIIRKTKYKGFTSTPVSLAKSLPNRPDGEGNNIRKKYPGFGKITNSKTMQSIEMSESREEDWDSSLREWIPSKQCTKVQKRKTYRGFGEVTNSQNKKKTKTGTGVLSNFDNTNKRQPINNRSTEKVDENDNTNVQENYEVLNDNCNYDDMATDTDTDDDERKKLLDGVVMTISGYEDPLRGRIVSKAVAMGASYRPGWTNDCSHLVCGFVNTFKYLQAKGRGKIVQGTWIEDCYKLRKKVDWKEYILSEEKGDHELTEKKTDNELTEEKTDHELTEEKASNELTKEKADHDLTEETFSKRYGLRFLADMEVRLKNSCSYEQLAGKTASVRGMYNGRVHVIVHGYGQLSLDPGELEHLKPERGDKVKYVMKCLGDDLMEVINVDEGEGIAVVRYGGYKGAVVKLSHLSKVLEI